MNADQMKKLAARLRDHAERFIFQGGSQFAEELADLIERTASGKEKNDE